MKPKTLFWILFLLNLFNYIDRQVLFAVFPLIQTDLQLTDRQLGALGSVFMAVYMCYAPLVGYFADRTRRQYWIGASALIWSLATLLSGLAKNFNGLLLARGAIGVGEGGFTTIAQPFLAEHFPKEKRATILAYFGLALPAGSALGYLAGGLIGQHFGWRIAFMLVAVPGIFLGLLALCRIKDPAHDLGSIRQKPKKADYKELLRNKPFILLCLAHAMQTFVLGGLSAWMPTYFHRFFDMSVAQAGSIFGLMVIAAGALGTFIGGKTADKLLKKTDRAYFVTILYSFMAMLPFALAGLLSRRTPFSLIMFFIAIVFIFIPLGPISAAIVALTKKRVQSMAFALNIFIIHLLGDAFSPVFIGHFSDLVGLKLAVTVCVAMMLPASIFIYLSEKYARVEGKLIRYYTAPEK